MKAKLAELKQLETVVLEAPDQQISLTEARRPGNGNQHARRRCRRLYVQAAVDTERHLIVAHDVTNVVVDRALLSPMARMAKEAMVVEKIDVLAEAEPRALP